MKSSKYFNDEEDLKLMKKENNKEKVKEHKNKNNEKYNQKVEIKKYKRFILYGLYWKKCKRRWKLLF